VSIKLLPSQLINQIAAGEVIEKPASIIKELVENSIDADAKKITIKFNDGGKSFIQVIDDGCGMSKDDLKLSFQRHATSKIAESEDLINIKSLGFRGEALPSIASVSQIVARSATEGSEGSEIIIHGGVVKSEAPSSILTGTFIQVKNLFFNTPARRKFLKKTETEKRNIYQVVKHFMLAYPQIAFSLLEGDRKIYKLEAGDLHHRITQMYGRRFSSSILPVSLSKDRFSVNGYIGSLNLVKKRQGEQYLFLNGRSIQNRLLNSSIYSSYKSLLNRGEYPFFVLSIDMPPDMVDVNVHPAKSEVRFQDEWRVFYVVKSAAAQALSDLLKAIPDFHPYNRYSGTYADTHLTKQISLPTEPVNPASAETAPHKRVDQFDNLDKHTASPINENTIERAHKRIESIMKNQLVDENIPIDNVWQLQNKYIITEVNNGLIIIDQHVAHERILFESAKKALDGNGLPSQTVLFPQTVKFQPEEYVKFIDIVPYLNKIGFRMRDFGENTVIIEGIPSEIYSGTVEEILHDILDKYIDRLEINASFLDHMAATYACKSAIKAGERLKNDEMINLVDKLFATEHPYYCPHGRPIIISLSMDELDRRFERI